jgi:hypothetical protein
MNSALTEAIHGFLFNRSEQERTGKKRDTYRDVLRDWLMTDGREDENGHRYLDFDDDLTIEGKTWRGIQAQRRISASIDLDAAEELAKSRGIYDEVFPIVEIREFNEDALYAANQRGLVSDADLDALVTEHVTFAIVPVKA